MIAAQLTTEEITIREDEPDPGDYETLTVTRDATGRIRKLVWLDESTELDSRYQPVRWTRTTYRWRPRLKLWDQERRANDLYPGKPDHVERDRVNTLPAELVGVLATNTGTAMGQAKSACPVCAGAGEVEGTGGGMRPCPECVGELSPPEPEDDE